MSEMTKQVADNTANIATNTEILDILATLGTMYGPVIALVIALLIYTWRQKEKTQDKLEQTVVKHIEDDDKVHDKLFTELRSINQKVDMLIGKCNERDNC